MEKEGKYIYCIIGTRQDRNFGPLGIGGRGDEVLTIGYDDLSMVVSSYPVTEVAGTRENMVGHEKVIEDVMREFDSVLPVRFGTIASNADEIRSLLDRRRGEFKNALRDMDHKVELGVKAMWKDMDTIFDGIVDENKAIRNLRQYLIENGAHNIQARTQLGQLVKKELDKKKERQAEEIADRLRRTSFGYKLNKAIGDEMFMNAAFLVDRGREKEFDNIMDDLGSEYQDAVEFMYAGPLPVFNFVNILIYPAEWEE